MFRLRGDVFGAPSFDRKATPRKGVKTLVPVVPSKIIAVGINYLDHAREMGRELPKEPLIWFKATTSLLPDGGKIEIPFPQHRTDFEAELAIVIGRKIRNVSPTQAARYIFGYTAAQDISDRTIQKADGQWARCKSFDTFTPLGPLVETMLDPGELNIQQFQNGQLRQNSNTSQLIFKPAEHRQLHLHEHDAAARRRDSHRHAQRRRPDPKRRQTGSADSGPRAADQYGEIARKKKRQARRPASCGGKISVIWCQCFPWRSSRRNAIW